MQRGLVFRVHPTLEQVGRLAQTFGCCRVVYNAVLAEQERHYQAKDKRLSFRATSALLTRLKQDPERAWLREPSCVPLQQELRHLHHAYVNFFAGRAARPRFKRKDEDQSAEYTRSAFTYDERTRTLVLAKLGRLKVRWSRTLPRGVQPSTVTVRRDRAGRYFASLRIDSPSAPLLPVDGATGVDVGIAHLASLPDGTHIDNPRHLTRMLRQLGRAQRGSVLPLQQAVQHPEVWVSPAQAGPGHPSVDLPVVRRGARPGHQCCPQPGGSGAPPWRVGGPRRRGLRTTLPPRDTRWSPVEGW